MAATRRRAVGVATALALVWATALVGFASGAAADEGLTVAAQSTYVLDTESDEIRATVTIDLVNVSPDRVTDDGVYSYFFTAFSVPVPAGATDVRAVSDGSTLTVARRGTDDPSTALLRLSFPELTFEQSRRIDLTFTVPGAPPRSADSTRVGKGYATFVASSPGDPGRNEVRVVVPSGTSFTSTSDGFERTGSGDTDTWTSTSDTEGRRDLGGGVAARPCTGGRAGRRRRRNRPRSRVLPRRPELDRLRRRRGDRRHPRPRGPRREPVARGAAAHPRGRHALAAGL